MKTHGTDLHLFTMLLWGKSMNKCMNWSGGQNCTFLYRMHVIFHMEKILLMWNVRIKNKIIV